MLRRSMSLAAPVLAAALAATAPAAHAVTECSVTPSNLFVGGDSPPGAAGNYFYVAWAEGGASVVYQSDGNYKPLLAVVMSAKLTRQRLTVRYQADNVSCTANNPGQVLGIWLL